MGTRCKEESRKGGKRSQTVIHCGLFIVLCILIQSQKKMIVLTFFLCVVCFKKEQMCGKLDKCVLARESILPGMHVFAWCVCVCVCVQAPKSSLSIY